MPRKAGLRWEKKKSAFVLLQRGRERFFAAKEYCTKERSFHDVFMSFSIEGVGVVKKQCKGQGGGHAKPFGKKGKKKGERINALS